MKYLAFGLVSALLPRVCMASAHVAEISHQNLDLTRSLFGYMALLIFFLAYTLVVFEDKISLPKSKPVMVSAAAIWAIIGWAYHQQGIHGSFVKDALRHNFLEYAELFFFLLVAMTYINTMVERNVFEVLRQRLTVKGFSYRQLFWLTGILAFFISPVADNLTTALILCTVLIAVGKENAAFISLGCINIVVAANAGGAFSPFGDITTLMVWQKEALPFWSFFKLFLPSMVNFLVPAIIMSFAIDNGKSQLAEATDLAVIKPGGIPVICLFLLTIITAVLCHSLMDFPPSFGMMTGLAYLATYAFYMQWMGKSRMHHAAATPAAATPVSTTPDTNPTGVDGIDIFKRIAHVEWDTLLFFYGVILSVGGLAFMGYLSLSSGYIYDELGPTVANILVGVISALVDNIPVMFAVLTMNPAMSEWQWLLVTLTAGVGGSLLSVGSAAGVALMGQAKGHYTFFSHLKWSPVIALGYVASILVHYGINF